MNVKISGEMNDIGFIGSLDSPSPVVTQHGSLVAITTTDSVEEGASMVEEIRNEIQGVLKTR